MGLKSWAKKQVKKVENVAKYATFEKNPLHKADDVINKNLGGYTNLLTGAGIVAASIATGGIAAGALGVAEGAAGATIIGSSAVAGAALASGSVGSGIEARKAERDAAKIAAAEQAEVDKANAVADAQRRASLFALRRQVGAVNVGKSSIFGSGSASASTKDETTGIILG